MPKLVLVVNEGQWGDLKRDAGDYDAYTHGLVHFLKRRGEGKDDLSIKEVASSADALHEVARGDESSTSIVFTTRGMFRKAQAIRAEHPNLNKVVVLTGFVHDLPLDAGVIPLDKAMIVTDPDTFYQQIVP